MTKDPIELERKRVSNALEYMESTEGFKELSKHIDSEIELGWKKFIVMPVEQKTSKMAYYHQARYDVLNGIKEWIAEQIKLAK